MFYMKNMICCHILYLNVPNFIFGVLQSAFIVITVVFEAKANQEKEKKRKEKKKREKKRPFLLVETRGRANLALCTLCMYIYAYGSYKSERNEEKKILHIDDDSLIGCLCKVAKGTFLSGLYAVGT